MVTRAGDSLSDWPIGGSRAASVPSIRTSLSSFELLRVKLMHDSACCGGINTDMGLRELGESLTKLGLLDLGIFDSRCISDLLW